MMKKKWLKRLLIILTIILVYVGAYFIGQSRHPKAVQTTAIQNESETMVQTASASKNEQMNIPVAEPYILHEHPTGQSAERPVTFFLTDLQLVDPESTIAFLKSCSVNMLTVPLVWSKMEAAEGNFEPQIYDALLEPFVNAGFRFVFLLDGAGRVLMDENGNIIGNSLPAWMSEKEGITRHLDFQDRIDQGYGLNYANKQNLDAYLGFCEKTIQYFGEKYTDHLCGFAPCIMNEFEIKYPQVNYAWTDYSIEALAGFRQYLTNQYGSIGAMNEALGTGYTGFSTVAMPVIAYNNTLTAGALNDDPLFVDYLQYREKCIVDYTVPIYELIHSKGYRTISYFGQMLAVQDAIYACGVATKLSKYVDTAVADFNFYDGYDEVLDSMIPAMMVNYLYNAGYQEVWAGLYFERINYLEYLDVLQETIDYVIRDGIAQGFEVGGLIDTFLHKGMEAAPGLTYSGSVQEGKKRIAIYASEWNFYKDHGEKQEYYNYFSDSLVEMFKILRFELGYSVDILCDDVILAGALNHYDLLVLPGQFFVDEAVRARIEQYVTGGGKALMDFRFGEWKINGQNTGSWSDSVFSIGGREAFNKELTLKPLGSIQKLMGGNYRIRNYYPELTNAYAIASFDPNAEYLFTDNDGHYFGFSTKNTVVMCFQPQILYKYADNKEEKDLQVAFIGEMVKQLTD